MPGHAHPRPQPMQCGAFAPCPRRFRQTLAALLIDLGRYDKAIETLHQSLGDDDPNRIPYTNFRGSIWAYFGLTQAFEGMGSLTPDQQKGNDRAREQLAEYCPPTKNVCALSLDRM
ncbi:tetratricopeptide repeat protein [Burkholderia oklahomensis]|uniref:tetratricopeptide repeat protein n=1 Tax=Burkholderia oklahomensis TaxID=342113 RepID=UPI00264CF475|nr:tetratricopeptide repeat protein [Burkholderia oklahomensis]MDN7673681.1 tetratricopeptide repeat protein [Burkholderia oklahomensis]